MDAIYDWQPVSRGQSGFAKAHKDIVKRLTAQVSASKPIRFSCFNIIFFLHPVFQGVFSKTPEPLISQHPG